MGFLFQTFLLMKARMQIKKKKKAQPYLEFNKTLHLILFSFLEKFNMNIQVLHFFKLWGNC